jgi:endoglucanase
MKKIESISGLLSVRKTPEYQALLDYWKGVGAQPTKEFSQAALMGMASNLKLENCRYNKDVIQAIFHELNSEEPLPYSPNEVPGIIYATDYDLGYLQQTWSDQDYVNYNVSTGIYTAWNSGWEYRNDGVDIEKSNDTKNTNGYDVGWTASGEWMNFTINADTAGIYSVDIRVASASAGGSVAFSKSGVKLFNPVAVPATGGWQSWTTITSPGFYLDAGRQTLRLEIVTGGFNLGSFQFNLLTVNALEKNMEQPDFSIYPNPTSGRFSIKQKGNVSFDASFSILDPLGRVIYPYAEIPKNGAGIDLSGQNEGIYFIAIKSRDKIRYTRILYHR